MRTLLKLVKVIVGLAIAIPVVFVVVAVALGTLGAVLGLVKLAVKVLCVGLVGYGLFRLGRYFFAPAPTPEVRQLRNLPLPDPYYSAAMRELDVHLGSTPNR